MITILDSYLTYDLENVPKSIHTDIDIDGWFLGVGNIPLETPDLQAYLDGREADLLAVAQQKDRPIDVLEHIKERVLLKAFVKLFIALIILIFNEINILRVEAGLPERTKQQVWTQLDATLEQTDFDNVIALLKKRLQQ